MSTQFILTLKISDSTAETLTALRTRFFPAERNFLSAHITLFHALPEELREVWEPDLFTLKQNVFPVVVGQAYSLGRGVAFKIESEELLSLHGTLQKRWRSFLSAQDLQGYRPHCTIQNKVAPELAKSTLLEIEKKWEPLKTKAEGLELFEYCGGPWRRDRIFQFA